MKLNSKLPIISLLIFQIGVALSTSCAATHSSDVIEKNVNNTATDMESTTEKVTIRPGQARALKELNNIKYHDDDFRTLTLTIKELSDNQGLEYLGGVVGRADLDQYLQQLQTILGSDFEHYRQRQAARDHNMFHVTVVNPMEYQLFKNKKVLQGEKFRIHLHGLGRVSKDNNTTYFVVASSGDGQFIRQQVGLTKKDFHITLGFDKRDVYGVNKGIEQLIKQ